jgi:hypothetical protein
MKNEPLVRQKHIKKKKHIGISYRSANKEVKGTVSRYIRVEVF